jgi:predicted HicB family RNase H-like nuclease
MASMEYKGYIGVIEVDNKQKLLHGTVVNTRDVITFVGKNVEELEQSLKDSVEFYLEVCAKNGREPNKPASGKFVVRVQPELHGELMRVAARTNKSLNTVVREAIEEKLHDVEALVG